MNELEVMEIQIKESVGRFLLDLQSSKFVNESEFENIDRLSREIARQLKADALVPKSVLNELYKFVKVVRAEVPYIKEPSDVKKKADAIEMTFDLILRGESHGDRQPGVLRVF
jgi:hypothetical protein